MPASHPGSPRQAREASGRVVSWIDERARFHHLHYHGERRGSRDQAVRHQPLGYCHPRWPPSTRGKALSSRSAVSAWRRSRNVGSDTTVPADSTGHTTRAAEIPPDPPPTADELRRADGFVDAYLQASLRNLYEKEQQEEGTEQPHDEWLADQNV